MEDKREESESDGEGESESEDRKGLKNREVGRYGSISVEDRGRVNRN